MKTGFPTDEICESIHGAAQEYIFSRVEPKDILDLDIGVRLEDDELEVEVFLITTGSNDGELADGAADVAMQEGNRLIQGEKANG